MGVFARVHSQLLLALPCSPSATAFLAAADAVATLLRAHPWAVIQHNVDATLAVLARCASPRGPALPDTDDGSAERVYMSLTAVLAAVLAQHRLRVRGRHALVVALFQQLLTALFPPPRSRRKSDPPTHPPWLPPGRQLSYRAARAFARVLQAFCDPPVSTVRSGKELTESQRSREKKLVAAVVGTVLECYVMRLLQLQQQQQYEPGQGQGLGQGQGQVAMGMPAEVRREVAVGMEKLFEVLGRDGVRRVAAGRMGADARAVVRALWAEFCRGRGERV